MEERVREKEQEVAELRTLELHTRELASMFDNFYNDFNRINSSMAESSAALENWREVTKIMTMPVETTTLLQACEGAADGE